MATQPILRNTPLSRLLSGRVLNFDSYGSYWGTDTVAKALGDIAIARADGRHIDEWTVTGRAGEPLRIVRVADGEFLDTISVIPGGAA